MQRIRGVDDVQSEYIKSKTFMLRIRVKDKVKRELQGPYTDPQPRDLSSNL